MPESKEPRLALGAVKRSNRHRVVLNVPVRVGLKTGTLVDISETGILATHYGTLKAGSTLTVEFSYQGELFAASGRVESCTVVGLGVDREGTGGTVYASRIFFADMPGATRKLLDSIVKG